MEAEEEIRMPGDGLTLDRVKAAAARLDGVAHRTPVLSSSALDQLCGGQVLLKAEPFQRSGSFKFPRPYNRLCLLHPAEKAALVVPFPSGDPSASLPVSPYVFRLPTD